MPSLPSDIGVWRDHFQDEADAAFLYRALASVETDPKRRDVFNKLAQVEDRHTGM
jgi:rubrerythrin